MSYLEIEEEGTISVSVRNDPKYKQAMQRIYELEDELRNERVAHGETRTALADAQERIAKLLGEKIQKGREKGDKQRKRAQGFRVGNVKVKNAHEWTPEMKAKMRENLVKARAKRTADALARKQTKPLHEERESEVNASARNEEN